MADRDQLNRQISSFYDDYHRGRERKADVWMQTHYWPAFVGQTLEVGGGTLHPKRKNYAVVDLSTEAVRRTLAESIPAAVADGMNLPFQSQSFETVACYDVLEHVVEPEAFIAELCRVTSRRIIVAGPNFIAGEMGNLDRRLPGWLWQFLTNPAARMIHFENPHLIFDDAWSPDRDAVTAANAAWVADHMKQHGFHVERLRTWEANFHWLNNIPAVRALGPFMFLVGEKA